MKCIQLDDHIGVCVKSEDGFILERNSIAVTACGQFCKQICIQLLQKQNEGKNENAHASFHYYSKIKTTEDKIIDIVLMPANKNLVTLIYPLDEQLKLDFQKYEKFNLTKTEIKIMDHILKGETNQQIADALFISKSTLKKHINNIYKKIPKELRPR